MSDVMTDVVANGTLAVRPQARLERIRAALSFTNISAVYIFVLLFVLFSLWVPDTFLATGTWKSLPRSRTPL